MDQTLPTDHLLQASQKWEMPFTMDQSKMQYSISKLVDSKKSKSSKLSFMDG